MALLRPFVPNTYDTAPAGDNTPTAVQIDHGNNGSPTEAVPKTLLVDGAFFIDNSTYEDLITCDRYSEYHIIHKRTGRGGDSALNFGGAVHAALETRARRGSIFSVEDEAEQISAALDYIQRNPLEFGNWRTTDLLVKVIRAYNQTYPVEDFNYLVLPDGTNAVEVPFALPLGEIHYDGDIDGVYYKDIPIVWTGKIDGMIERGEHWILDNKTTSIMGPTYFNQFYLSGQMTGYCFAANKLRTENFVGAMINCLAIREPTKTGKGTEFKREWIRIPPHQVGEWQHNTLAVIASFFANVRQGFFPMKTQWCINKYNRKCPYWDVCTLQQEHRLEALNSNLFRDVTWNPLKKD
jgi:hypothetical protein